MANNNRSRLPDTPWHVGYAYKDENDPRRHKARCIHYNNQKCMCMLVRCTGSSHCKFYAERYEEWEEYLEEMKTEEEKAEEDATLRALKYRIEKQKFVRSLLNSGKYMTKYKMLATMMYCPFCGERLKDLRCPFCLAQFVKCKNITEEKIKQAADNGHFLVKSV